MSRSLITLVSDQTLPNVLFIRQFGPFDRYVFVTTHRMEDKGVSDRIISASRLKCCEKIVVESEKVYDVLDKLDQFRLDPDEVVIVNITGGTKMMSLGTYAAFSRLGHDNVAIYYMPIQSASIYRIYPDNQEFGLNAQVSLDQYLKAYGIEIVEHEELINYQARYEEAERLLGMIRRGHMPRKIIKALNQEYRKPDKSFYLGKWLEIYTGFYIMNYWNIAHENIRLNMKLTRTNRNVNEDTEYDVVFVRNNKLYIAECKYFSKNEFSKSKINKDWYKLAGLKLDLGLSATPFFVTANEIEPAQKAYLHDIKELYRIKGIADIHTIGEENEFSKFLNSME